MTQEARPQPARPQHARAAADAADDRLIVALDVPDAHAGLMLARRIGDAVSFYKIGLGMLTGGGLALANELKQDHGKRIFLDMKLFDIGATVEAAVRAAEGEYRAEAEAIEVVFDAIHSGGADSEVLAYQYLQSLPKIADGQATTMFVVPAELTRALQGLGEAFAPGDGGRPTPEHAPRRRDSGDRAGEPGAEHVGVTPERARRPRGSRPTTADALRASGVMDAMTAGAVTAEDMPQTSLDEALATPKEIEPDPSAGRTPGTRPAGEADGNAVGH